MLEFVLALNYFYYRKLNNNRQDEHYLGRSERNFFVKVVLKLIDRGQYSKNEHLSETVAAATSILSYVEPSLILPFVASRFHMALETVSHITCIFCSRTTEYGQDAVYQRLCFFRWKIDF